MFTPTVESVSKKATQAVSIFEKTQNDLAAAIESFKGIIVKATTKIGTLQAKIDAEKDVIKSAREEMERTSATMTKISALVQ